MNTERERERERERDQKLSQVFYFSENIIVSIQ